MVDQQTDLLERWTIGVKRFNDQHIVHKVLADWKKYRDDVVTRLEGNKKSYNCVVRTHNENLKKLIKFEKQLYRVMEIRNLIANYPNAKTPEELVKELDKILEVENDG